MAITRSSLHKRRATGGRRHPHQKKRKYSAGRPAAMTKMGPKRIHLVRGRGGNLKFRALRLETGNFSWGSEAHTAKTRILDVVYNASNNELVRTKTLVKGAIVLIDATPFKTWFESHYHVKLGGAKGSEVVEKTSVGEVKTKDGKEHPSHSQRKALARQGAVQVDEKMLAQFSTGRLYAALSSRPGQSGRADGYVLEGPELDFYLRKLSQKKTK